MKKIQTAFRIDVDLLNMLKKKATAQKRSLNNYIEYVLYRDVGGIPNEETKKAIYEAQNDINLSEIEDIDEYFKNLLKEID